MWVSELHIIPTHALYTSSKCTHVRQMILQLTRASLMKTNCAQGVHDLIP